MKLRTYSILTAILLAVFSINAFACDYPCTEDPTHHMSITDYNGQYAYIYYSGWDSYYSSGWGTTFAGERTLEFTALDANTVPQHMVREGYCIELDQGINGGQYDVELKHVDLSSGWQKGIAWLAHNINVVTDFQAAAMQLAIWEVVYDGFASFNPDTSLDALWGGNFRVSSWYSGDLKQEALSYLGMLANTNDFSGLEDYRLAKSCDYQDMLVTPVPAAVWLMGSGLFGLIAVGRRRSSKES